MRGLWGLAALLLVGCGERSGEAPAGLPSDVRPPPPSAFDEPPTAPACVPAYLALAERSGRRPDPAVRRLLEGRRKQEPAQLPVEELRRRVLDATGVEAFAGQASWAAGPPRERAGLELRELVASDPLLGRWPAARLSPPTPGRHPGVLLLHGHGDTVEDALSLRFGEALAREGFVVLAPSIRAYWDGECESAAAWALLAVDSTLLGAHLAEAARAVEQLRADPAVDPARVFVLGHSGGGGIARLVPFVAPVAGVVTDGPQAYGQVPPDGRIGDDFVPALEALGPALAREDSLGVPSAFHPIGPDGDPAVVAALLRSWAGQPAARGGDRAGRP